MKVFVLEYQDKEGAYGYLPFENEVACIEWTESHKDFKPVTVLGYGEMNGLAFTADNNIYRTQNIAENYKAVIEHGNLIMEDKEAWKNTPGGISGYVEMFSDPQTKESVDKIFMADNPEKAWSDVMGRPLEEYLFKHELLMWLLTKSMPVPKIEVVSKKANELIQNCKLTFKPTDYPKYLSNTLVLKGNPFLMENVFEIAILPKEDDLMLIIESLENGHRKYCESGFSVKIITEELYSDKAFDEAIEINMPESLWANNLDEKRKLGNLMRAAIQYVVKYNILLESEKTPIMRHETDRKGNKMKEGLHAVPRYHYISLTKDYSRVLNRAEKKSVLNRAGKKLAKVEVTGFIRQQAIGKNWSERKTIFVSPFERGQWINEGVRFEKIQE